ncbi:hypothetical protein AAFF_G00061400 [Aldrovandia affinis]|uniref:Uncharacterized protein n=1 Tax=Aldrovandia affinis TaxID=143900 RepID=A0AAD7WE43_9TELE|nr:hypothetical protein AAFF_G00061400 [Aldrovandia affinis]
MLHTASSSALCFMEEDSVEEGLGTGRETQHSGAQEGQRETAWPGWLGDEAGFGGPAVRHTGNIHLLSSHTWTHREIQDGA